MCFSVGIIIEKIQSYIILEEKQFKITVFFALSNKCGFQSIEPKILLNIFIFFRSSLETISHLYLGLLDMMTLRHHMEMISDRISE